MQLCCVTYTGAYIDLARNNPLPNATLGKPTCNDDGTMRTVHNRYLYHEAVASVEGQRVSDHFDRTLEKIVGKAAT
jgi:hypothetical protein